MSRIAFEDFCMNLFRSTTIGVGFLAARGVECFLAFFVELFFLSSDFAVLPVLTLAVFNWFFHAIGWP